MTVNKASDWLIHNLGTVNDENKYEVTEDLYKDRRRIVPDATQSCSVSGHPCEKRGQEE